MAKEKVYLTVEDLENEIAEFIDIKLSDGKYVMLRKLTAEEAGAIKRKCTLVKRDKAGNIISRTLDEDMYQLETLARALVKPKLTKEQIKKMFDMRLNEIFYKYSDAIGLFRLTENLGLMPRVS